MVLGVIVIVLQSVLNHLAEVYSDRLGLRTWSYVLRSDRGFQLAPSQQFVVSPGGT